MAEDLLRLDDVVHLLLALTQRLLAALAHHFLFPVAHLRTVLLLALKETG